MILSEVCHRTRQHVSLRLDSELSELEQALMAAHLARCTSCRAFADDLEGLTETLRAAPLAEPSVQFQLPRRPARFGVAQAGSAAAAAITVAVALVGIVGLRSSPARISAVEVQSAQERISVKEQLFQALDGADAKPVLQTPPGVEAAEQTTLLRVPSAASSIRISTQGLLSSAELPARSG